MAVAWLVSHTPPALTTYRISSKACILPLQARTVCLKPLQHRLASSI